MPRARFTSPYFGDGMNNLATALVGNPLQDVQAGLMGDKRKLTQAQERKMIADALLGELDHERTRYDDQLARLGAPSMGNIDPNIAELGLRGGGNLQQRGAGLTSLLGADAALGGDPYTSMALQGNMPGPDYSPSAGRADAVSARNADESMGQATEVARISGLSRVLQTALQEQGRASRPQSAGTPLNVNATQMSHLEGFARSHLARVMEERGINYNEGEIADMVDQVLDYVTHRYQDTRDAGAAIRMAIESFSDHIEATPKNRFGFEGAFGFDYGGNRPEVQDTWSPYKEETMRREAPGMAAGGGGAPGQHDALIQGLLGLLGGGELPQGPAAPPAAAPAPQPAPAPMAPPAPVSPVADALGAGAEAFNPESEIMDWFADPANRNVSHPAGPEQPMAAPREAPPARTEQDMELALAEANRAIQAGADPEQVMAWLQSLGIQATQGE